MLDIQKKSQYHYKTLKYFKKTAVVDDEWEGWKDVERAGLSSVLTLDVRTSSVFVTTLS